MDMCFSENNTNNVNLLKRNSEGRVGKHKDLY